MSTTSSNDDAEVASEAESDTNLSDISAQIRTIDLHHHNDDDSDNSEDTSEQHVIRFGEFIQALSERIKTARHTQLTCHHPRDKAEHTAYWRDFFDQVRSDAAAESIPRESKPWPPVRGLSAESTQPMFQRGPCFAPSMNQIGLVFARRDEGGPHRCPCCLDNVDAPDYYVSAPDESLGLAMAQSNGAAEVMSRHGVTFDLLVKGISEAIYGTEHGGLPVIGRREHDRLVLHEIGYMVGMDGGLFYDNIYIFMDDISTGVDSIDGP